jgi:thiamine transport system ATP-binding protein
MSKVRLEELTVRYDQKTAVAGVTLELGSGEALAVLGPSGSGKSSLLRAMAGLIPIASGRVWLDGKEQTNVPTYRRKVGLMFQNHALFPHLNVAENVAFGLRMAGVSREERRFQTLEMLTLVGLKERATAPVSELSGGEQQRVALARTLAPSPQVVLLDEPLGSLDRALRNGLLITMKDAFAQTGATVMLVTHDQAEAFALGGHVGIMRSGRLVQVGSHTDLWNRPADGWIARFLGQHNVLLATDLPHGFWAGPSSHELVIRPESLCLLAGSEEAELGATDRLLPGRVVATEFRGGYTSVRVAVDRNQFPIDLDVFVLTHTPAVGELVKIVVPATAITSLR